MNTTIIKFDALPDAVGPATENHNLLGIGLLEFVLFPVGRIIVWSVGFEFRRAGINQPEDSTDPQVLATLTRASDGSHFQRSANWRSEKPASLASRKDSVSHSERLVVSISLANPMNLSELGSEPQIDSGLPGNFFRSHS